MNPLKGLITPEQLAEFCERWKIVELIAYEPIRYATTPEGEVQLMIVQRPDAQRGLIQHMTMQDELSELIAKPVLFVTKHHIQTSHYWDGLREKLLKTAQVIYVAG